MSIQTLGFTWRSISSLKNPSAPPTPPSPPSETWSIFDRLRKKKHLLLVGWWFCMAKIQRISFYASSRWLCKRPSLIMKKNIFLVYICLYHQYSSMIFPWTSTSTHPFGWCWGWKRSSSICQRAQQRIATHLVRLQATPQSLLQDRLKVRTKLRKTGKPWVNYKWYGYIWL